MNLITYQTFVQLFERIRNKAEGIESLPLHSIEEKIKFYKMIGAKTPEERERQQELRGELMKAYIEKGLPLAKVFEIDKVEKRLMLLTDSPRAKKLIRKAKLPYPSIFLDVDIDTSEMVEEMGHSTIEGILIMEIKHVQSTVEEMGVIAQGEEKDYNVTGRIFFVAYGISHYVNGERYHSIYDLIVPVDGDTEDGVKYDKQGKATLNYFRNFILNLLIFINHPDVTFIKRPRGKKNVERRIKQGKLPLPESNIIRLTGEMKRYVDSLGSAISGDGFDHKFWVRGHWRHHRSERYVNAKDKVIWIAPFLKGKGELEEKVYSVEANKKAEREYKSKFVFYDDIEPATKSLRELRGDS